MRNEQIANAFNDQDGLYTLIEQGSDGPKARIIGSISKALCAATQSDEVLKVLCDPAVRVVTTTVTEKGYGIDRARGGIDKNNAVIAGDLKQTQSSVGVIGLIVTALARRRANNVQPFTVLCCDNLPDNGTFLRAGLVDRITPAQTSATRDLSEKLIDARDDLAIETERFHQWVIEDNFPTGRLAWEVAGAIFTRDVALFEKMKLRLLNCSHSLIAYMGLLLGQRYVRDVMADPMLEAIVRRHLEAATASLPLMPEIDLPKYCADLIERFRNPNIAHETFQISADGSEKMPQRIFAPAVDTIANNGPIDAFVFATALWIWFCKGNDRFSFCPEIIDPRADQLKALTPFESPEQTLSNLEEIPGLFPRELMTSSTWRRELLGVLDELAISGHHAVIESESCILN